MLRFWPPPHVRRQVANVSLRTTALTMNTQQVSAPQDSISQDQFLGHVLHLEPKDVTLKFIFDHIRNYGICGAMLWASTKVLASASVQTHFISQLMALLGGSVLLALPWVLFAMNFGQGIMAAFKLQKSSKVSMVLYLGLSIALLAAASQFMMLAKAA